jgi:SOS-response transcriptional repressor LexA
LKKLTEKEQAVFDYVCKISIKQGYAPSVRDICKALDYKSTSTVQMYLDRLLEYGYLSRETGKKRSLRPAVGMVTTDCQREIRIAFKTEHGELTEDCFDGSVPFFCGSNFGAEDLFAFRMSKELSAGIWGEGFGIVCRTAVPSLGEFGVFSCLDGGLRTMPFENQSDCELLGKLIAVIHILH